MTKTEMNRFRAILTAKVAELEHFTRHATGSRLSEVPINWTRSRRLRNEHSRFVTSIVNLTNFEALARPFAVSRKGRFGICQGCDENIHPKRLAAVPWTLFCIRCQEAVDRNLEGIEAPSRDLLGRAA
jgi:DnaK suppressor protein